MCLLNILLGHDGLGEGRIEASPPPTGEEIVRPSPSPASPASPHDPETGRIAALDAERHARDRLLRRGCDYDPTQPGRAEHFPSVGDTEIAGRARASDRPRPPALSPAQADALAPAKSLLKTCREYGVGLRLEPEGTLVVKSNGKAWRSLMRAIEAHADGVVQVIEAGWDSNDA